MTSTLWILVIFSLLLRCGGDDGNDNGDDNVDGGGYGGGYGYGYGGYGYGGGGHHDEWDEHDGAEEYWVAYYLLAAMSGISFAFSKVQEQIETHLKRNETSHFHVEKNLGEVAFHSFHEEITVLGLLSFSVGCFDMSGFFGLFVGESMSSTDWDGPSDSFSFLHSVERVHISLFLAMMLHVLYCYIAIIKTRRIIAQIERSPGYDGENEPLPGDEEFHEKLANMTEVIEKFLREAGYEGKCNPTDYLILKFYYDMERFIEFDTNTWIGILCISTCLSLMSRYSGLEGGINYFLAAFYFVCIGIHFSILMWFGKKYREGPSYDVATCNLSGSAKHDIIEMTILTGSNILRFFAFFHLMYILFGIAIGTNDYWKTGGLQIALGSAYLILSPQALAQWGVFVISCPPFFDSGDLCLLKIASREELTAEDLMALGIDCESAHFGVEHHDSDPLAKLEEKFEDDDRAARIKSAELRSRSASSAEEPPKMDLADEKDTA